MSEVELLIIGAGPAGYVGAIRAAQLGIDVCVVEKERVGGTCLNVGCIPTKSLLSYADDINSFKNPRPGFKIDSFTFDKKEIYSFKDSVVKKLVSGIEALFKSYGVELLSGSAVFKSGNEAQIGDKVIKFKKAIIATGSIPMGLKSLELDGFTVDSTYILEHEDLGERVVIVGGGIIGCELAFILNSFGANVTIIEKMMQILPSEDRDCVRYVDSSLKKKGVRVLTDTSVEKLEKGKVTLSSGEEIKCDRCVVTIGRVANTKGLMCEKANVNLGERGEVIVDSEFKTSNPDIYAVGDVVGSIQLAHYASASSCKVVSSIAGVNWAPKLDAIPRVTYSFPELASVGLTESMAKSSGIDYKVGRFMYGASGKALAIGETEGLVKVLTDSNDKLIGGAVVGRDADNLIVPFTIGITLGLTAAELSSVVYPHPTLSEMILEACEDVHGKAIHKGRRGN